MKFLRIGTRYINPSHIIMINTDFAKSESYYRDTADGGYDRGSETIHYVRIVTAELTLDCVGDSAASASAIIDYKHGTPEADAITVWAASQAEVLYPKEVQSPDHDWYVGETVLIDDSDHRYDGCQAVIQALDSTNQTAVVELCFVDDQCNVFLSQLSPHKDE